MFLMKIGILKLFGRNIKKLRKAKGWSQEELAKRVGLHRTYIGSIERTERNISLINAMRIARTLNVTVNDLIGEKKPK
jgi:transcriptional regulator with XRE-family HTH domain